MKEEIDLKDLVEWLGESGLKYNGYGLWISYSNNSYGRTESAFYNTKQVIELYNKEKKNFGR